MLHYFNGNTNFFHSQWNLQFHHQRLLLDGFRYGVDWLVAAGCRICGFACSLCWQFAHVGNICNTLLMVTFVLDVGSCGCWCFGYYRRLIQWRISRQLFFFTLISFSYSHKLCWAIWALLCWWSFSVMALLIGWRPGTDASREPWFYFSTLAKSISRIFSQFLRPSITSNKTFLFVFVLVNGLSWILPNFGGRVSH